MTTPDPYRRLAEEIAKDKYQGRPHDLAQRRICAFHWDARIRSAVCKEVAAARAAGRAEALKHFANTLLRLSGEAQAVRLHGKRAKLLREMAELANQRASQEDSHE